MPSSPSRARRLVTLAIRGFVALALAGVVAAGAVHALSTRRLQRDYRVDVEAGVPDPALAAEGAHLARSRGCMDCHGADLGGKLLADEMPFARLAGDNLTSPSPDPRHVHARMLLALRHGLSPDRRPLLMMPSTEFAHLSAREIEAIAAYVVSLPRVQRSVPDSTLGPLGRALLVAGKLEGFLSAEAIDHAAPMPATAPATGTLAHGRHLALMCTGCHRKDFGGGPMDKGPPGSPPAANLTAHTSGIGAWSEGDFIDAIRSGVTPDGRRIDPRAMPLAAVAAARDEELRSIYRYLRTVPPVARDVRARSSR